MSDIITKLRHLATGVLGLAAACSSAPAGYSDARGDAAAALASNPKIFLLDVRTPEEYADGHLKGSTLVPVHELEQRLQELPADKSRTVLVYCAVGGRSARAGQLLISKGWTSVVNLAGGISGWIAEGRPVVK